MLRFHVIGDWKPGQVRSVWTQSTFCVLAEAMELIDRAWEEVHRRPGVHLFDGPMCRLESYAVGGEELRLTFSRTSYKLFMGTNLSHPDFEDCFGRQAMSNPVGASCALIAASGELLMGRRNENVAYYPGRIHPFAGALEPSEPLDVFDEVRRELAEELSFDESHIAEMRCLGLAEDLSLRQPELIFLVRSTLPRQQIEMRVDREEHHGSWFIPPQRKDADAALRDMTRLTPVGVAAILLWGRIQFGREWFKARCPELGIVDCPSDSAC